MAQHSMILVGAYISKKPNFNFYFISLFFFSLPFIAIHRCFNLHMIHFNMLQGESGELQFLHSSYSRSADFRGKVSAVAA